MLVDPEVLRAFDAQFDAVAATISGLDVGGAATHTTLVQRTDDRLFSLVAAK